MRLCSETALAALLAGASWIPAAQQASNPSVLIPVTVIARSENRPVTGLREQNFELFEDNAPQQVTSFGTDIPISVGILYDLSGSEESNLIPEREAILEFVKTSNPRDEFFVIGFSDRTELLADFTSSAKDIEASLANVQSGHRTALLDAIYLGLTKLREAHNGPRALLIVSDGADNLSRHSEREVRSMARQSEAEIVSMAAVIPYSPDLEQRNGAWLLRELADDTGGMSFRMAAVTPMGGGAEAVSAIARQQARSVSALLRHQYNIGYNSTNSSRDGKWRKVRVKLNPPQGSPPLTVHARTGYYAPLQ